MICHAMTIVVSTVKTVNDRCQMPVLALD
jgi:hypothetical protein